MGNDCFIPLFFRTSDFSPLLVGGSRPFQYSETSSKSYKHFFFIILNIYIYFFKKKSLFRAMNMHKSHESIFGECILQVSEVATFIAAAVCPC